MNTARSLRLTMPTRRFLLCGASVILVLSVTACVTLPQTQPVDDRDLAWVLAGADVALPTADSASPEHLASLLHVTGAMRDFAKAAVRGESSVAGKAGALAKALGAPDGLHLRYDVLATLSAEQVFAEHRANCLSYTLLYVALAREVGVPARFNEVDIPPIWDSGDDNTLLLYRHINARIDITTSKFQIVDVSAEEYDPNYPQRIISDRAAQAQYYNNRAVELRLAGQPREALGEQLTAMRLAPDAGYLWTNLGSLYLLNGNARAARIAVTRALTLDRGGVLNYNAAANVYAALGQPALAAEFQQRAQQALQRNPYYHYELAIESMRDGQTAKAEAQAQRAIDLYDKDPRFYVLYAVLLKRLGQPLQAGDAMHTALALTPDENLQARYRSKFARLGDRS